MFRRFLDARLFEQADEGNTPGAGTGDGGNSDGAQQQEAQQQQQQPLTLDAIIAALSTKLPEVIKPMISSEVNGIAARFDKEIKKLKTPAEPPPAQKKEDDPFKGDRERELLERLQAIENERKAERTQALEKETDAEVKSALSEFQWSEGEGKSIAFDFYRSKARRDEDGNLVVGELPLAKYIREHASRNFKNYFQPRDIGGSGAQGRNSGASKGVQLDSIKPGMSKDIEAAAAAELLSVVSQLRSQR